MRFLKVDRKTVDLVGNEKLKASASVKHLALPCNKAARAQVIPDIIRCYSQYVPTKTLSSCHCCWFSSTLLNISFFWFSGGQTIIFTETKDNASELSGLIPGSRALHGDVVQAQREVSDPFSIKITTPSTLSTQLPNLQQSGWKVFSECYWHYPICYLMVLAMCNNWHVMI